MPSSKFAILKPARSKGVSFTLPPELVASLADTPPSELYYIIVNGVLQVSAQKPTATIPVLRKEEFA